MPQPPPTGTPPTRTPPTEIGPGIVHTGPRTLKTTTGRDLRAQRNEDELSQIDLVNRMHAALHCPEVTTTTISHWEAGRRVPSPWQLLAWCLALRPTDARILTILTQLATHPSRGGREYNRLISSWSGVPPLTEKARVLAFREWANARQHA